MGETAEDGGQPAYLHGQVTRAVDSGSMEPNLFDLPLKQSEESVAQQSAFDLLSEEDLEDLFEIEEEKSYEKNQ